MLKIITMVNKPETFDKGLKKSLKEQKDCDFELFVIDNTKNVYKSLCSGYMSIIEEGNILDNCEFILFCHPDIYLNNSTELSRLFFEVRRISTENNDIGVFGVAGAKFGEKKYVISTIEHGEKRVKRPPYPFGEKKYEIVQTVDSCFYFVKTDILKKYPFNRNNRSFHMLIEEYNLRLYENGIKTVVVPAYLWHFSAGASLDYNYYLETKRVTKLHRECKYINTTSFHWTNNVYLPIKLDYYAIRNYIHHSCK